MRNTLVTALLALASCLAPANAFAWASLWVTPVFDVGDSVDVLWDADTDYCWDSYYTSFEASASGSDGFYGWDWKEYGNGGFLDTYASQSGPYTVYYYLTVSVYSECDYESFFDSSESRPAARYPVATQALSEGVVPPQSVCALPTGCTSPPWEYTRLYQLMDQWGEYYHGVAYVYEDLTMVSSDCNAAFNPQSAYTNSAGQFVDRLAICADACCTGGYCRNQYFQDVYANGSWVANHWIDEDCYGINSISP